MKKLLLISTLFLSYLLAIPSKEGIDQLVEEIKPSRVGVSQQSIKVIHNPFIMVKTVKEKDGTLKKVSSKTRGSYARRSGRVYFKLYATLNKSAKINHKWIPLNGKINGYTLKEVTKQYVTLQKGLSKPVTVYLNKKNKKIRLQTK